MKESLKLTNDFVFKSTFGEKGCEPQLKALLEAILGREVSDLVIQTDLSLFKEYPDSKLGILDVKALLENVTTGNKERVNIELQMANEYNIAKRTMFYWSKLYLEGISEGDTFQKMEKTITINILGYNQRKSDRIHTIYKLLGDNDLRGPMATLFSDVIEVHFLELVNLKSVESFDEFASDNLKKWLTIIKGNHKDWVTKLAKKDKIVEKVVNKVEYLSGDAETRRRAELVEKWRLDELNRREGALNEGREEGRKEYQLMIILNAVENLSSKGMSTKEAIEQCAVMMGLDKEFVEKIYNENKRMDDVSD